MHLTGNGDLYGKGMEVDYKKINNLKDEKVSVFSLHLMPYVACLLSNVLLHSPIYILITVIADNAIYVSKIFCILFLMINMYFN